jgi:hypothetical protein
VGERGRVVGGNSENISKEAIELVRKVMQNRNLRKNEVDELKKSLSEPFKIKTSKSKEFPDALQVGLEFQSKIKKVSSDTLDDTLNDENENIAKRMSKDQLSNQRIQTNREKSAAEVIGDSIDVGRSEISQKDQNSSQTMVITPKEGQISSNNTFVAKVGDHNVLPKDGENLLAPNF